MVYFHVISLPSAKRCLMRLSPGRNNAESTSDMLMLLPWQSPSCPCHVETTSGLLIDTNWYLVCFPCFARWLVERHLARSTFGLWLPTPADMIRHVTHIWPILQMLHIIFWTWHALIILILPTLRHHMWHELLLRELLLSSRVDGLLSTCGSSWHSSGV